MESPKPATEPAEAVTTAAVITDAIVPDSPKPPAESASTEPASTEPATVTAAAQTRQDEEPASVGSLALVSPAPEPKAAHEEAPAPERVE